MDIDGLRGRMDEITLEMTRLLRERTDIAEQIGQLKKTAGRGVTDEARERALRAKVMELASESGLDRDRAARLLNFLLNESVKVQSAGRQTHMSVFLRARQLEREGRKIIHMEVGEPDFGPPAAVGEALGRAVPGGYSRYGEARGRAELRERIAAVESSRSGAQLGADNVIVTPGARFAIYLAVKSLLSPGDEMIIIEPAWPAYRDCALDSGVKVRAVQTTLEGRWAPDTEELRGMINENTAMIVLNYPNNPTGMSLPEKAADTIIGMAREKGIYVLSDEIYSAYSARPSETVLRHGYDRAIAVQSFSKSHAMTGFRIGYAAAHKDVISKMAALQALAMTCVSEPVQYAAMEALDQDVSANARTMSSRLSALSGAARDAGLEFAEPDGAMYLFARPRREGFDGSGFASRALEEGLAVAPGAAFGNYREFVRISACADEKTLKEGVLRLGRLMEA